MAVSKLSDAIRQGFFSPSIETHVQSSVPRAGPVGFAF